MKRSYDQLAYLLGEDEPTRSKTQSILDAYEIGAFSEGSFLHRLQRLSSDVISERQLIDAWNAMLGPIAKIRFDMLARLKEQYTLYLLSNTNHTHLQFFYGYLQRSHGIENIEGMYFAKAYYSHLVRMSKPDRRIYEHVIEDVQINPAESIFIDDNLANVESAREVGLHAVHHDSQLEISEEVDGYVARCVS